MSNNTYTYKLKLSIDDRSALRKIKSIKKNLDFKNTKLPKFSLPKIPNIKSLSGGLNGIINSFGGMGGKLGKLLPMMGEFGALLGPISIGIGGATTAVLGYATALGAVGTATYGVLKWGDSLIKSNNLYKATFEGMEKSAEKATKQLSEFTQLDVGVIKKDLTSVSDLMSAITSTGASKLKLGANIIKQASVLSKQYGLSLKDTEERLAKAYTGETEGLIKLGIKIKQGSKEFKNAVQEMMKTRGISEKEAKGYVISAQVIEQSSSAFKAYQANLASVTSQINNFVRNSIQKLQNFAMIFTKAFNQSKAGKLLIDIMHEITTTIDSFGKTSGLNIIQGSLKMIYALFVPIKGIITWLSNSISQMISAIPMGAISGEVEQLSGILVEIGKFLFDIGRVLFDVIIVALQLLSPILTPVLWVVKMILKGINLIVEFIALVIEGVMKFITGVVDLAQISWNLFVTWGKGSKVFSGVFKFISDWIWRIKDGWNALIEGIVSAYNYIVSWIGGTPIKMNVEVDSKDMDKLKQNSSFDINSAFNTGIQPQLGTQSAISNANSLNSDTGTNSYTQTIADNSTEILKILKDIKNGSFGSSNSSTTVNTIDVFA